MTWVRGGGARIAFLAYNDPAVVPAVYAAGPHRASTNFMNVARMRAAVTAARPQADLVIVSMHADEESTLQPDARQRAFARAAIEAGADVVIGHHPHVVKPEEIWHGKPIFYSLGNFVFDQDRPPETQDGVAPRLHWVAAGGTWKLDKIEPVPVHIEHEQPRPTYPEQSQRILARLSATVQPH